MALLLHALPAAAFSLQLLEKSRTCRRGSWNNRRATVSSSLMEKVPIKRRQAVFPPSVWDDSFIESLTTYDEASIASTTQRIDDLKEKVHYTLILEKNPVQMMNLVDAIERLGLAHHFEKDIQSTLQQLYEDCHIDDNLHDVALRFRLLRQEGFDVSCDVFDKFIDRDGRFKQSLRNDVCGLLSLYEASHLSIHGEDILDEALTFTTEHLKSISSTHSDPAIYRHVKDALYLPLRKCIPRLETRRFISYYETNEERNNVLLELAKFDFNLFQSYQRREIKEVQKWRKELDFTTSFPFARDRLVELYLIASQIHFLPQFSKGRIVLAKYIIMFTTVDDIYDAHGTLDELELFTNAFVRSDLSAMNQQPDYLKLAYLIISNMCNEIEYMSLKDRGSSAINYLRKSFGDLCKAYLQEARWVHDGSIPSMDEYLKSATLTTNIFSIMIVTALGMRDLITKEALDYMIEESKLPWFISLIIRFSDDLAPSKDDDQDGITIQCYMKEHGVAEEVAHEHIKHWLGDAWKGINQEVCNPNPVPKPLIKGIVNYARMCETFFANGNDGLGDPKSWTMNFINSLFFESIPM